MAYTITREIGIDMAHRVPTHGSKCANIHGHRYKIIAEVEALLLHQVGEQSDMVLDFGFLKQLMMDKIDSRHDHGLTLYCNDPWAPIFMHDLNNCTIILEEISKGEIEFYFCPGESGGFPTKLMIVDFIPTAEKLAEFWFNRIREDVIDLSHGLGELKAVTVWETPNCVATYRPE